METLSVRLVTGYLTTGIPSATRIAFVNTFRFNTYETPLYNIISTSIHNS